MMKPADLVKKFDNLEEKYKKLVIGAIIFLLLYFICYKLIYQNAARKAQYYNAKLQEGSVCNKLRKELSALKSEKERYEAMIMHKDDIDGIKNRLSNLAQDSGAKLISINSTSSSGQTSSIDYNAYITTMELECTYHQLGDFISKIENMRPYVKIDKIKLGNLEEMSYAGRAGLPEIAQVKSEGDTQARVQLAIRTYLSGER